MSKVDAGKKMTHEGIYHACMTDNLNEFNSGYPTLLINTTSDMTSHDTSLKTLFQQATVNQGMQKAKLHLPSFELDVPKH